MILKRIQTVLALLFVGSVSMLADGGDPFPEVDYHQWQNTMTVTGKVRLNGVELKDEAIVAAYYHDEIRGKQQVKANGYLYLSIGGAAADAGIPFHFKVFTGSSIVEVDQGLEYVWNEKVGSYADPYIINLPLVTTTTSSEGWATTCLPYNAAMPDAVTVYAAREADGDVLRLTPLTGTILPKETPVLLKTDGKKSVEWLSRVADGDVTIETNLFKGTTEATTVEAGSALTLGHASDGNKAIGFWQFTGTEIPANRAYLEMPAGNVRGFTLSWSDEVTALAPTLFSEEGSGAAYDLQGRKVRRVASKRGSLMIVNGKKLIVK